MRNRLLSPALATLAFWLLLGPGFAVADSPSVVLVNPPPNTVLNGGDAIRLQATANDADGTVLKVEFYQDGVFRAEAAPAPFQVFWSNSVPGTYQLSAVAVDDSLERATSAVVSITIAAAAGPRALVWSAPFSPLGNEWNKTAVNWRVFPGGQPTVFHDGDSVTFQGPPGPVFLGLDSLPAALSPSGLAVQSGGLSFYGGDLVTGGLLLSFGASVNFSNYSASLSFPGGTTLAPAATVVLNYDVSSAPQGAGVHFGTGPIMLGGAFGLQMGSNRVVTLENDFTIGPQGYAAINVNPMSKLNGQARFAGTLSLGGTVTMNIHGANAPPGGAGDGAPHEWAGPVLLDQSELRQLKWVTQTPGGYPSKGLLISGSINDGPGPGTNRLQLENLSMPFVRLTGSNSYANGTFLDYSPLRLPVEIGPTSTLGLGDVEVAYGGMLRLMGHYNIHSNASVVVRGQVILDRGVKVRLRSLTLENTTYTSGLFTSTNPLADTYLLSNGTFRLPVTNLMPSVSLVSPTNGAVFASGTPITLQAAVNDVDSYIARVEFRLNGALLGVRTNAPWQLSLHDPPAGAYAIQALVWDDDDGTAASAAVSFSMGLGLRIESIESLPPNLAVLEFEAPTHQPFELQATDILLPPSWTNLMTFPVEPTPRRLRVTNALPPGVASRFYRLLAP